MEQNGNDCPGTCMCCNLTQTNNFILGPAILKKQMANIDPSNGPAQLDVKCYQDGFTPAVGRQYVLVTFGYSYDCVSEGTVSTATALTNSTQPISNSMQQYQAGKESSAGLSDSVALSLVLTLTGMTALIITCIGLNCIISKTSKISPST